jgi:tetratricopeptide (TPR) repeat protein
VETASPALEAIWRDLRPHLEWAQGFALAFLFAGHPEPVRFLRQRLEESLQLRTLRLTVIAPSTAGEVTDAVEQILATRPDPGRGPLWVELWRGSAEEGWPTARRQALHRLNERRFLLESNVALPMVLLLPSEERGRVYIDAPDLWAVRCFTAELPAPPPREVTRLRFLTGAPQQGNQPSSTEREWARLLERAVDRLRLDPRDASAAFESALERGDLAMAQSLAKQGSDLSHRRLEGIGETPQTLRDLSIALNNLGRVERDLAYFEAARSAFCESLELCRHLRERAGDTPQVLRELSIALDNVGQIESDYGNLEVARAAFLESLELRRRMREMVGDTPQALRDLSVSLDNLGQVGRDLGDLEAARGAWHDSLEIARVLRGTIGETPQALRDLTVALVNTGRIEFDLGNLEAARSAYRESLEIAHRLRERVGDTARTLCDLAIALVAAAQVEHDLGNSDAALSAGRDGLEIIGQLRAAFPNQPQFQHDLSMFEARAKALTEEQQ